MFVFSFFCPIVFFIITAILILDFCTMSFAFFQVTLYYSICLDGVLEIKKTIRFYTGSDMDL